jgi:hypothetical protein
VTPSDRDDQRSTMAAQITDLTDEDIRTEWSQPAPMAAQADDDATDGGGDADAADGGADDDASDADDDASDA